jgi:transcription elongation factor Elf1
MNPLPALDPPGDENVPTGLECPLCPGVRRVIRLARGSAQELPGLKCQGCGLELHHMDLAVAINLWSWMIDAAQAARTTKKP